MPRAGGITVLGLKETVRALERAGVEIGDLKDVFGEIARAGAGLASGFAPKRTNRLASSIRGNKAKNKAMVIAGGARVRYAGPINYGWRARGIQPSEFLQRADEALSTRIVGMLEDGLSEAIRRAGLQ